jgi:2,4-dienoyl-CoA reductase-like NADH-dependent reductase (Old Yellow Enzyme family)
VDEDTDSSRRQFLSARVNKRTDAYGGTLENRSRIVFEIIDEIKKTVPKDFILAIKVSVVTPAMLLRPDLFAISSSSP